MVRVNSPGPKYLLPSTVGQDKHDPTKTRAPGAVFGLRPEPSGWAHRTPAPKYNIDGLWRKGKLTSPGWIIAGKPHFKYNKVSPSPLSYGPQECPDLYHPRPPAWYLGNPHQDLHRRMRGPAPKYLLPTTVANNVPDKTAAPAYTILGRDAIKLPISHSPGPGRYPCPEAQAYLKRSPTPALLGKFIEPLRYKKTMPGPKYLVDYNEKNEPPSWVFGVKHSNYEAIPYAPEDLKPFYGF